MADTRYYIAPDGYGGPTVWRDYGPDDTKPHALLVRTDANAELFDLVAGTLDNNPPAPTYGYCTGCGSVEVALIKATGTRDLSAIGESANYPTGYGCELCS